MALLLALNGVSAVEKMLHLTGQEVEAIVIASKLQAVSFYYSLLILFGS